MIDAPLVLAFYYPWYGTPDVAGYWHHWKPEIQNSPHTPKLGKYDSYDPAVIKKHIEWAKKARIDGFVVAWTGEKSFTDDVLKKVVDIADAENFLVSVYIEDALDADDYFDKLTYIGRTYGNRKCWIKTNRPVVFIYRRVLKNDLRGKIDAGADSGLFIIADVMCEDGHLYFDGQHIYLPIFDIHRLSKIYSMCGDKFFLATVSPGFDDSLIRKESQLFPRYGIDTYELMWQIAVASNAKWAIISTWNEWQEDTQIEPAKEYGFRYLRATKKWSIIFKTSR
jgi:hypothetical protein